MLLSAFIKDVKSGTESKEKPQNSPTERSVPAGIMLVSLFKLYYPVGGLSSLNTDESFDYWNGCSVLLKH